MISSARAYLENNFVSALGAVEHAGEVYLWCQGGKFVAVDASRLEVGWVGRHAHFKYPGHQSLHSPRCGFPFHLLAPPPPTYF